MAGGRASGDCCEFQQAWNTRHRESLDLHHAVRCFERRQACRIRRVARQPAAVDQHRGPARQPQRRHDLEAGDAVERTVVDKDRCERLEFATQCHPQRQLPDRGIKLRIGLQTDRVCIAGALPLDQTQFLLIAAAGLPIAELDCDGRECDACRDREPDSAGGIAAHCQRRWDNAAAAGLSDMRVIIILAFIGIIVSLGSALVFLVRDRGGSSRTVHALTVRVGLSVALFLFILFSYWMGWIEPRSY